MSGPWSWSCPRVPRPRGHATDAVLLAGSESRRVGAFLGGGEPALLIDTLLEMLQAWAGDPVIGGLHGAGHASDCHRCETWARLVGD